MTRRYALPGVAPPNTAQKANLAAGRGWPKFRSPSGGADGQVTGARDMQDHCLRQGCVLHPTEDTFAAPVDNHNITHGARVNIFARTDTGRIIFEGVAHCGPPTGSRRFEHLVVFMGEHRPRRRLVLPGPYQTDPERLIEGLSALYAKAGASDSPDTFLSDMIHHATNDNSPASNEEA